MIDSHCHLTCPEFSSDIDAVLARAKEAGVETLVTISDALEDLFLCHELASKHRNIFWTAGVHPHHAKTFDQNSLGVVREAFSDPACRAVGEIGLDYHYMNSPKDTQQRVFESQLVLAKELGVPAVVHCRDAPNQSLRSGSGRAVEDVWTITNHVKPPRIVLHCCTEKWSDVEHFVSVGHFLSFTGIATYPKSEDIRETIRQCPIDQLMIETDAPFLAPVPYRGKRNESAFVVEVAKVVASVKGLSLEEVDRITTKNAVEFFRLRPSDFGEQVGLPS